MPLVCSPQTSEVKWCKSEILLLISNNHYRREYHQTFDSLPSAMDGMNSYCDTCTSKGKNSMTAKVFCTECKRKYCAKHEEVRVPYFIGVSEWEGTELLGAP